MKKASTNLVASITLSLGIKKQDLKKTRLLTNMCFSEMVSAELTFSLRR